jgi:hypothetical protein
MMDEVIGIFNKAAAPGHKEGEIVTFRIQTMCAQSNFSKLSEGWEGVEGKTVKGIQAERTQTGEGTQGQACERQAAG